MERTYIGKVKWDGLKLMMGINPRGQTPPEIGNRLFDFYIEGGETFFECEPGIKFKYGTMVGEHGTSLLIKKPFKVGDEGNTHPYVKIKVENGKIKVKNLKGPYFLGEPDDNEETHPSIGKEIATALKNMKKNHAGSNEETAARIEEERENNLEYLISTEPNSVNGIKTYHYFLKWDGEPEFYVSDDSGLPTAVTDGTERKVLLAVFKKKNPDYSTNQYPVGSETQKNEFGKVNEEVPKREVDEKTKIEGDKPEVEDLGVVYKHTKRFGPIHEVVIKDGESPEKRLCKEGVYGLVPLTQEEINKLYGDHPDFLCD